MPTLMPKHPNAERYNPRLSLMMLASMPFTLHAYQRFQCSVTYPAGRCLNLRPRYCLGFWSLITLLALSSGPSYAEWMFVRGDDEAGMTLYVDPHTIQRTGDLVKMWHLSDRKTVEPYGSIKSQREYDCAAARHRLLSASIFSEHMGHGEVRSDNIKEGQWIPVGPESSSHALWKIACGEK